MQINPMEEAKLRIIIVFFLRMNYLICFLNWIGECRFAYAFTSDIVTADIMAAGTSYFVDLTGI